MSWPVCLLFLIHWGQLFLGGSRCLGALKTSSHHSFSNFSVLTHAGERGRGRLLTSRRWRSKPFMLHRVGRSAQRAACLSSSSWGPWAIPMARAGLHSSHLQPTNVCALSEMETPSCSQR